MFIPLPEQTIIQDIISQYEVGTFTKWKRFRGVGFEKKYSKSSDVVYNMSMYPVEKLVSYGNTLVVQMRDKR